MPASRFTNDCHSPIVDKWVCSPLTFLCVGRKYGVDPCASNKLIGWSNILSGNFSVSKLNSSLRHLMLLSILPLSRPFLLINPNSFIFVWQMVCLSGWNWFSSPDFFYASLTLCFTNRDTASSWTRTSHPPVRSSIKETHANMSELHMYAYVPPAEAEYQLYSIQTALQTSFESLLKTPFYIWPLFNQVISFRSRAHIFFHINKVQYHYYFILPHFRLSS